MLKVGITGNRGFIGSYLKNVLSLNTNIFEIIPFERSYFNEEKLLEKFVKDCHCIVHLAGVNRHESDEYLYKENINIAEKLGSAILKTKSTPHLIMASSSQEVNATVYGLAKQKARLHLEQIANENGFKFNGLLIPNVFGPFSEPNYNTFIATFCKQLIEGNAPNILIDKNVSLIYIDELVKEIVDLIEKPANLQKQQIKATSEIKVNDVLEKLKYFKDVYYINGVIPNLQNVFELQLFNTFRSFIDYKEHFPIPLKSNLDQRGNFVELIKTDIGGQFSFSTTMPNITRGNHFHTRKVERFMVLKGKALIQLRKYGSDEVLNFELDGEHPSYVDMPVWYIHNIKNIGEEVLFTNFWINEAYNPADPDTYFEVI